MPSYWPIKNTLVQILHCFACDTGIRQWESRLTNYVLFLSLWSIQSMSNQCCAKEKYKQKRHVLLENMGNKQTFSKNSFFFCQCLDQTRLKFPIENPQKQPTQRPEAPTDASCSIHGSKCAGSRYRIELRQLVYLNVGVSSRFFYKWSFVIGGPYKMAENSCGFFYPYKMELYTSYPFSKSITFYANLRFCHRFSEAELV